MESEKHICGVCEKEFKTEEQYLEHVCEKTDATPADAEHLIKSTTPNFAEVSKAALKRGEETKE